MSKRSRQQEIGSQRCRLVSVRGSVEPAPLQDSGEAEEVVAVVVGHAEGVELGAAHSGVQHLALSSLPAVDEGADIVEADQRRHMIALPRRCLAGGSQDDNLTAAHAAGLKQTAARTGALVGSVIRSVSSPASSDLMEHLAGRRL